jgi:uncharacterized phage protein (TIGR01671 family)
MEREIKFRGKRLDNGEWVYGYYVKYNDYSDNIHESIIDEYGYMYDVDLATVGQYTGLKDKNGREICEGDIVMVESRDEEYDAILAVCPFLVMFSDGWFCIAEDEESPWGPISKLESLEVIGNIHDHPELLKQN